MEKNNNLDVLAHIIAFNQVREHDEYELIENLFKIIAKVPRF